MEDRFANIVKEIQKKSFARDRWDEVCFYQDIVRGYFIPEMGYKTRDSYIKEDANTFHIGDLLIRGSVEEKADRRVERGFRAFIRHIENCSCKWGILIRPDGIWLMNSDIIPNNKSSFTNSQIVLEIRHGMNTDQKYFRYFSAENIIGNKRNACFFRDIMNYKNNEYKGTEKSWPAYESALKRFFDFYAEYKGDYGREENIYDYIQYPFFVEFMKDETKCTSLMSARNSFFYIKDFMQLRSKKGEFDDPERVKESFSDFVPRYEMQDVMRVDKLREALMFLDRNKNRTRNKTLLLFLLAFGMERRKLCALKWQYVHFESKLLKIDNKSYPLPRYLIEMLKRLKEEGTSGEYVFCNSEGEALGDGAVNTILSGVAKADLADGFYRQLTPANIRRCLAKYLLRHGYPLQNILYLMDIEGYKLDSYLARDEIEKTFWNKPEDPVIDPEDWHPMEKFLDGLR